MMPQHSSRWRTVLLELALCGALSACGLMPHSHPKPDPVVARVLPPPTPRTDGAIYQSGQQIELFADLKARRVGDVLTIRLTEVTNASKSAVTKTTKTTSVNNTGPQTTPEPSIPKKNPPRGGPPPLPPVGGPCL